ncbi:MAG: arginine decarboxylase, partial [Candidatus Omnitrophota bacterium]
IRDVNNARDVINHLEYFRAFGKKEIEERDYQFDPLKLTINVRRTGISGYEISEILNKEYNIQVDCFDMFNLIAILGVGTVKSDLKRLIDALIDLDKKSYKRVIDWQLQLPSFSTEMVLSPRDAMFSYKHKHISLKNAPGHICAQVLTPYPPGVPVLMPGERISQEICDYLKELSDKKIRISGQEKDTLASIKVVKYEKK